MPPLSKDMSETITLPIRADFGELVYPPGGTFGPRVQRTRQVFVVFHGDALVRLDNSEEIAVGPGEALLLMPGRLEYFRFATATKTALAWCHIEYADKDVPSEISEHLIRSAFPTDHALNNLLEAGNHLKRDGTTFAERALGSAIISLLRDGLRARAANHLPVSLQRALTFIERSYENDLTAGDIARAATLSGPSLRRLFRAQLGCSPMEALWRHRLQVAVSLLKSSGLPIAEIAYRCGFKSPYHFSRRFRSFTGESPRAFRDRQWSGV
jgi:AraC family transcriptional regulator